MSSCSSAESASATSARLQSCSAERSVEHAVQPPDQDVGEHVEPADEIELLEDHGAARAPVAAAPAAQAVTSMSPKRMAPAGRVDQPVDHAQQRRLAGAGPADHADESAGFHL